MLAMYLDCWLVRYMIAFRGVLTSWVPTNSVPKTPQVGNLLVLESPSSPVCVLPNTMLSQTPTSRNWLLKNPHLVLENVLCKSEFLRTAPSFEVLARDFCDKLDDELKLSGNTKNRDRVHWRQCRSRLFEQSGHTIMQAAGLRAIATVLQNQATVIQ